MQDKCTPVIKNGDVRSTIDNVDNGYALCIQYELSKHCQNQRTEHGRCIQYAEVHLSRTIFGTRLDPLHTHVPA